MYSMLCHQPKNRRLLSSIKGFTLIEMMAVMMIVGVAASMAALSIGSGTRPQEIKNASRQLYHSMNLAFEEAVYANQQFGLRFDVNLDDVDPVYVYQWMVFVGEEQRWYLTDIEELAEQKLPDRLIVEIEVEGQRVVIGDQQKNEEDIIFKVKKKSDEDAEIHPDIYFFSSGETQNFVISIADEEAPDSKFRLVGNLLGQVIFKRPDEDDD
ncbi:MAG: prepilin-type N-terminal cleavage/methylation domain-containing protein [Pseudomonadales bacterium]|nr:prepilin-type N-terminal cleavage/methylation domain-containing protein [Pseudomonadales bacterium]